MAKKPDIDEPTLLLMERMLRMPPKPHEDMKLGTKVRSKQSNVGSKSKSLKGRRRKGSASGRNA